MSQDGEARRFPAAPLPLAGLIAAVTRPAFRRRSPAGAQVLADWPALVGPAIAEVARPLRLAQGTLAIACAGPVAMELQHLAPDLIRRINGAVGRAVVERLRFVQQAPARLAPAAAPPPAAAPLPRPVRARLAAMPEGELRQALENLARAVYRNP